MIVEDGTGVAGANSYGTLDAIGEYAAAHGLTFPTSPSAPGEAAAVRGTAFVDTFRDRFPGFKRNGRAQTTEWPRSNAFDNAGEIVANDEVPIEVFQAFCEASIREYADPGSLMPDLERGGGVRRLKAGSVEIEYGANAQNQTTFTLINALLSNLLSGGNAGGLFADAGRG